MGTQKNCLIETAFEHMFKLMGKTIATILRSKVSLSRPMIIFRCMETHTVFLCVREAGKGDGDPFAITKWSGAIKSKQGNSIPFIIWKAK